MSLEMIAEINRIKRDIERLSVWESGAGGGVTSVAGGLGITVSGTTSVTVARSSGTSFPGSPAAGDLFYRTDRNIEYSYDGTRWLTTQLFELPFNYDPSLTTNSITVNTAGVVYQYRPNFDYDMWVEDYQFSSFISGTFNSSNYWSVSIDRYDESNAATTLGSVSTWQIGRVINRRYGNKIIIGAAVSPTNGQLFVANFTKTSAPGALSMATGAMNFRFIG
jgi:hypothetical protein